MDQRTLRFRLGLFVTTAAILLAVLVLMFGGSPKRLFGRTNEYRIVLDDAPGVSVGTPVRRSGVKIGTVTGVELNDETGQVTVRIAVDAKYTIRTTDVAVVNQDLLSRDTTIDIVRRQPSPSPLQPPTPAGPHSDVRPAAATEPDGVFLAAGQPPLDKPPPRQPAPRPDQPPPFPSPLPPPGEPLPPGSVIPGQAPSSPQAALGQVSNLLPTAEQVLVAIRRLAERLEQTIPQLDTVAREFALVGREIRETVPEVRRTNDEILQLLKSARAAAPELRRTNEELQVTIRNFGSVAERVDVFLGTNQAQLTKAVDQTTDVLQRLSNVLSDENQKNFTASLRALQQASTNFDSIARDADQFLKEGQKTAQRFQGTLNQADQALVNINQATRPFAERSDRVLRNLDTSFEQLSRVLTAVGDALGPIGRGGGEGGTIQKFFTDPSLYNNLNEAACMVTKIMPRLDRILRDVEVFADKIARHPETIGIGGAVRPSAGLKDAPATPQPGVPYQPYHP